MSGRAMILNKRKPQCAKCHHRKKLLRDGLCANCTRFHEQAVQQAAQHKADVAALDASAKKKKAAK